MKAIKPNHRLRWAFAASLAAALVVVSPFCFLGQASGHDFQFHVASWADVAQQWRAGVILPRWAVWANHGFGEPRFIFYPPLSWCLGAALGLLLPWSVVPGTFIVLCLTASGISMFRLARTWLSPTGALAAAVLYAANPYQLVLAYVRSDFAELLAASLFPLAIYYGLLCGSHEAERPRELTGQDPGNSPTVLPLALVYAAIWLANAPAAVVASYALAFLLAFRAILGHSFRPLLAGLPALALGLLLAAFYVVPAAYERGWVNIGQINSAGFLPTENFLFTWILDPDHNLVNLQISTVAVLMITLTGIAAVVAHSRARISRLVWNGIFGLAALSVFLMLPASGIVWRVAPELRFLQFPWRWLLIVAIGFAFFLGDLIDTSRRRLILALGCAAVLLGTGIAMTRITYWDSDDLDDVITAVANGQGYDGTYEYCPSACDPAQVPRDAPEVKLLPNDTGPEGGGTTADQPKSASLTMQTWQPEEKAFIVDTPVSLRAAVRLLNYPAWTVRVNGAAVQAASSENDSQMILPVRAGRNRVEIRFARTTDRTIGGAISGLAALLWSGLGWLGWRRSKKSAS